MKKTYMTSLPDKAGAFQAASEIIFSLGLNITRVSYNKAVDLHMLFVEVEGEPEVIGQATILLNNAGYILGSTDFGRMLLIDFILKDRPGSVLPVLRLINSYGINISYISSQTTDDSFQRFRIGFIAQSDDEATRFLRDAALRFRLEIISCETRGHVLDNTVFYLSFANSIASRLGLTSAQESELIVQSNLIMEMLRDTPNAQYETFDYISRFAEHMCLRHGSAFGCRISDYLISPRVSARLIEPPCGSNICILDCGGRLIFVDGGFCCYEGEGMAEIRRLYPDFDDREKCLVLTHADVDHCGIADHFSDIYTSGACCRNFADEQAGRDNLREVNAIHKPYVIISKLLSGYRSVPLAPLHSVGEREPGDKRVLAPIGELSLYGLCFEIYEGLGGHTPGEIVLIERHEKLVFSGDIFINVKGCIPLQHEFNMLAPYLMTSVDTDPELAKREREELFKLLGPGSWLVFGGHGAPKRI